MFNYTLLLLSSPPSLPYVDSGLHHHWVPISLVGCVADPTSDWISFSACRMRSQPLGVPTSCSSPCPASHQLWSFRYHPCSFDPSLLDISTQHSFRTPGQCPQVQCPGSHTSQNISCLHHSFMDSTPQRLYPSVGQRLSSCLLHS